LRDENDPLIELYDMRIPEDEKDEPEIKEKINLLLEKAGSKLRFDPR